MADFFVLAELIKYSLLDNTKLMYHNAFVYKAKLKTESILDSYFTTIFGAVDNTDKEILNIKGCIVDYDTFYSRQLSITDCEDNEESFYFDITNQMFYIHIEHSLNPYTTRIETGKVYGYSNDKPRNFNGIDYIPLIKSIPNYSLKVDPLRYTKQSFYGGDIVFDNTPVDGSEDGTFDSNQEFTGNDIFLYYGENGDDYTDLIMIANNYIENTIISQQEITVKTKDKREQQTKKIPYEVFDDTTFPDIDPDLIGDIMPECYGRKYGIPGICIDSEQAGNKEFHFASVIQAAPAPVFYIEIDDVWTITAPSATDYANGRATFAIADIHKDGDNTKGLNKVMCVGYFRPFNNPGDIISDMNDSFLNISYNSSNYNTTEWEDEKQYLEDVGLYLDDQKEIWEWIELLQNGSTVGFQYLFVDGKRTIRLDNPNRNSVITIQAVEILNNTTLEFNNNEDFFATDAVIKYRKNEILDTFFRYENNDYHNAVMAEHRKNEQYNTESLLYTESQADDKSIIILEDLQKERPTGRIKLWGKEFFELLLFDIIYPEISYSGVKIRSETVDLYIEGDTGDIYIETDSTDVDIYIDTDYTKRDIIINQREYLGWDRYQIIGMFFDFNTGEIELEIRQRDYSDEFERITGYNPT